MITAVYVHNASADEVRTAEKILELIESEHDKVIDTYRSSELGPPGHIAVVCGMRAENELHAQSHRECWTTMVILPAIGNLTNGKNNEEERVQAFKQIQDLNTDIQSGELEEKEPTLDLVIKDQDLPPLSLEQVKHIQEQLVEIGKNEWTFQLADKRKVVAFIKEPEEKVATKIYVPIGELMLVYLAMKTLNIKEVSLESNRTDDSG